MSISIDYTLDLYVEGKNVPHITHFARELYFALYGPDTLHNPQETDVETIFNWWGFHVGSDKEGLTIHAYESGVARHEDVSLWALAPFLIGSLTRRLGDAVCLWSFEDGVVCVTPGRVVYEKEQVWYCQDTSAHFLPPETLTRLGEVLEDIGAVAQAEKTAE